MEPLEATRAAAAWMTGLRRDLHRHPELAYAETGTRDRVVAALAELGIEATTGFGGGTGVVAELGRRDGPVVALRSDMDALPIHEASGVEFASEHAGVMHACGHDAHMAMLLGAARVLKQHEADLPGRVKLLFQPAEEGGAGAAKMIEDGVLEGGAVRRIFGLHVWPLMPTGTVGLRDGAFLAAAAEFELVVRGKGGHAAMPNLAVDPIHCAAQVITNLQAIVSRERDPLSSNVVSVTSIHGGDAFNVIPGEVRMVGTIRSHCEQEQASNFARVREIAEGLTAAHRCEAEVTLHGTPYPPTVNHPEALAIGRRVAARVVGPAGLVEIPRTLGGEDFAFYAREVPGCFAALGVGNPEKGCVHSLHHPAFRVDEDALPIGAALHVAFAFEALAELAAG